MAYEMVGEQNHTDTIFEELRSAVPDDDKTDDELRKIISSAERKAPQPSAANRIPALLGRPSNVRLAPYQANSGYVVKPFARLQSVLADVPAVECSIEGFLERIFKPDETLCICLEAKQPDGSKKWIPADSGNFAKLEKWKEVLSKYPHLDRKYEEPAGVWIRINPLNEGDTAGSDKSVSDFRHCLVEFDSLSKSDQWDIYKQSGLPIAAVIDSGGKSLHAWVKVDAGNLDEFRGRQRQVYEYLKDYIDDDSNKNPSRFSRLPGVTRA